MKYKKKEFIGSRLVWAKGIVESVIEAGYAPCASRHGHEDSLEGVVEFLDQAIQRLGNET